MNNNIPPLGILQGRLTPTPDGSIQFFPKDSWREEFFTAKDIGFDCIEWLVKKDSFEANPIRKSICEISGLACATGLKILSIHGFYSKEKEFSSQLQTMIERAHYLSAKTILISFFGENSLKTESDKKTAVESIFPVLSVCERTGVRLGIETEIKADELKNFVNSFSHPHIGVYYDIGNMASIGANVADEIIFLGKLVVGVHVKDREANGGKTVPLGAGCTDIEGAFRALHQINYTSPIVIQGARATGVDDVVLNRAYLKFCRDLVIKTWKGGINE